ncbi:MAG: DUF192 domain-containing protein [Phycisphaeraceae bacterium]
MAYRLTALLIIGLCLAQLPGCGARQAGADGPATQEVTLDDRSFELEIAADPQARYQGLSDRESIAEDGGMLFVFPYPRKLSFVMRRCLVPIDIIFLGPGGRIVALHEMQVEPYDRPESELRHYSSRWPAQFAIELKGGTLDELDLESGDRVELPLARLKRMAE